VYVNAGTQLAQLDTLQGILSPALLGSFVLLGLFPLVARQVTRVLKKRQVYARWRHLKPQKFDRNLIVIGAGAGGLVTAYIAAAVKAKVTLVEAHKMGGDCLNYGCVPSKALIKSAQVAHQMQHGSRYGLNDTPTPFSLKTLMQRVQGVLATIAPHDSVARYTELGVEVLPGVAKIVNPWTVEITLLPEAGAPAVAPQVQRLTTRAIVIATGARPTVPPLPGLEAVGYLTSDTLWDALASLDTLPRRLLVLGGGPIGCELAQSFARLGAEVTLVEMSQRLLVGEDAEVSALVEKSLKADGVRVLTGHQALGCEPLEAAARTHATFGPGVLRAEHLGVVTQIEFEALLCAVGRSARLTGYGLEDLGIPTERTVITNDYLETIYPNIFAAGDVAGPYQLTHVAAHQAWYAAVNALFGDVKKFKADYTVIPRAIFTDPEVARVGLNEQEAREKNIPFEVTQFAMAELDRAIADSQTQGFVKILTIPGKDKILGVTVVGQHAGDVLAEYVLAMKHGLGLNKILGTIHTYPTLSEANKYAAGAWKRAHAPTQLLKWVTRYHDWKRG
jgi:pyruvate/2-oxoglutarate dehydrogenase complex dihydrolipoamide dehydrogenase (E3) component